MNDGDGFALLSVHEIEFRGIKAGVRGQNFQVSCGAALISNTCEPRGILLADTKVEFGTTGYDQLMLADEVLTPDSSRFWARDQWRPGRAQPSFDKQPLRDWLEASGWDKTAPGPRLPVEVIAATRARYVVAYQQITGLTWNGP